MADKKPIRAVFNDEGVATGLAEFQSSDTLGLTHGGLGASLSLGTAGQVLKVNSGASALEFGVVEAIVNIDNATDLTSNTLVASDLLLLSDGGTEGRVALSQIDTLFKGTTQTLTNKSIDLDSNTITGTLTEFNSALQSESFVGLAATQTLTNKTLTSPTINTPTIATPSISAPTLTGIVTATGAVFAGGSPLVFEGATANAFETTFAITDPTADRTITFQDATGTVAYLSDITGGGASEFSTVAVNTSVIFEGATADANETTLVAVDPTADRTVSLPNATDTLVGKATTDTLTNKTITASSNSVGLATLDIDGGTDIGAALADADLIIVDDGAGGTNRKAALSRVATYVQSGISGDITISSGTAAIGSGVIVNADINSSAAIAFSKMENLTASRALVSDGNGDVSVSAVTSTEIGYLDGVTSAIQTQLDTKTTPGFAIAQAVALG
ncbi:hypothetical protein [uncultured Mediterranean phage]|nr:hypothetical protein [uncultured Mediterranean phage]